MKKVLITILAGVLIAGCKEKAPTIVLEKKAVEDSAYTLTSIPATDPHNVLVEEFTGQSCSNCPSGHSKLEAAKNRNGGKVIVLGLYKFNLGQTYPPNGAIYDFRDSSATLIADQVYGGVNQIPSAGVDRVPVNGALKLDATSWDATIDSRVLIADSLNLSVVSSFNSATNEVTVTANIVYTKPVTATQNLSIAIVEDSMVDKQDFPFGQYPPDYVNPAYIFTNVLRGMITSAPFGDPILSTVPVKTAGMGLQRRYIYKLKSSVPNPILNPSHCRIVAFVTNAKGGDNAVAQAAETKMKP